MNEHGQFKEETLQVIREVHNNSSLNQRILSQKLNISLGKTNYLLKELVKKGFIKILSFSKNPEKAKKLKYILTHQGIEEKIKLTGYFIEVKEYEFNKLKKEYEKYIGEYKTEKTRTDTALKTDTDLKQETNV